MSKPIFIARIPWIQDVNMSDAVNAIKKQLIEELPDYHVLTFSKNDYVDFKFEVHNVDESEEPLDTEAIMQLITEDVWE